MEAQTATDSPCKKQYDATVYLNIDSFHYYYIDLLAIIFVCKTCIRANGNDTNNVRTNTFLFHYV